MIYCSVQPLLSIWPLIDELTKNACWVTTNARVLKYGASAFLRELYSYLVKISLRLTAPFIGSTSAKWKPFF